MKNLFITLFVALSSTLCAQINSAELVIIKIVEAEKGCIVKSFISITDANGDTERIELENQRKISAIVSPPNEKRIHQTILKYLKKDFQIKSHVLQIKADCFMVEKYIMVKKS